jgi:FAD/FMN-containing dehydrogenase
VPQGWFLSTTPGSRFVTLGGAVANDVHGKNHHRAGTFSRSVRRIGLLRSDRGLCEIGPDDPTGLFAATVGGLGLTGIITFIELQLVRIATSQLDVERIPFTSTREFFTLARESTAGHEHTVAWIDCVTKGAPGRGIFQRANWSAAGPLVAHQDRALAALPMDAPGFALNALTVGLFNALYYRLQAAGARHQVQHYAPFFYPLDSLRQWNRLYGRRGFYQYQCVIPPAAAEPAIEALVQAIVSSGAGSFLAVIKTFGAEPSCGVLSFPREGATLALDFANRGQPTLDLLARLDAIVAEAGGALYPAKDGRMPAQMFRASYPNVDKFTPYIDPAISSDFWRRVQL